MGPEFAKGDGACVLASNNASPAQRGPRRDAQPLHATPLAAVIFPARGARIKRILAITSVLCVCMQGAIAATTAAAAAAAVAYWLGRRHSLTGKSSSTDLCSCGASLAGMTEADRRFHQQSRRHITNCRALRRGRIVVAENFSEYRRSIETVVAATDRVLEVGCGRGVTTALIARRCGHVLGVDLSAKVIMEQDLPRDTAHRRHIL